MKEKLKCILLIDDDRATNFLNEMVIERAGCTEHIEIVEGGQQALEFLKNGIEGNSTRPDLIFLDINMPAMNGWEFVEEYKKLQIVEKDKIIIVMVTASLNPDDQIRAEASEEISGFRIKPLKVAIMNEIVKEFFPDRF
jgi:CheY-like chemotaxis protein